MCILLKFDSARFGVSNFFFKSYRRKTFGVSARPTLVKEGLKDIFFPQNVFDLYVGRMQIESDEKLCYRSRTKLYCSLQSKSVKKVSSFNVLSRKFGKVWAKTI